MAGICDASGLVLGLMPHPERFTRWTQHPRWTRLEASRLTGDPLGLAMFRNAVAHVG
ncbi:MAG: phosphoribosylformylglycinamidine synthase subunit PurQ [Planctomycetota bacterium]